MEEDIKDVLNQEKNKQKQMNSIKEIRVRDYIRKSEFFQNLFNLPVPISMDSIVERYAILDTDNNNIEISEEILNGIHKSLVQEISNDKNGIVLYENGTINPDASRIEEKDMEKEELRNGFHVENEKNSEESKALWVTEEIKRYVGISKEKEEELDDLSAIYERNNRARRESGASSYVSDQNKEGFNPELQSEEIEEPFDFDKRWEEISNSLGNNSIAGKSFARDMIKINQDVIARVKNKTLNEKIFAKMLPEEQYVIKRALMFEMFTAGSPENVVEAAKTLMPEYKDEGEVDIMNHIASQLNVNDIAIKLIRGISITEVRDEYKPKFDINSYNSTYIYSALNKIIEENKIYNDNGTINPTKFKEMHGDKYVDAALNEYKKNILERMVFSTPSKFENSKEHLLIGAYKEYLKQEVKKKQERSEISKNSNLDDVSQWKKIEPEEGTALSILERIIKENRDVFLDYMKGDSLKIDFEKVKEAPDIKQSKLNTLTKAMDNITNLKKTYVSKKTDIYYKIAMYEMAEDKEAALKEIKTQLEEIPRELYAIDFHDEPFFKDFKERNNLPDLGNDIYRLYERNINNTQNRKAEVARLRVDKVKADDFKGLIKEEKEEEKIEKNAEPKESSEKRRRTYVLNKTQFSGTYRRVDKTVSLNRDKKKYHVVSGKVNKIPREKIEESERKQTEKISTEKATIDKDISGVTSLNSIMAKPKMIVDEIEIPIDKESSAEKVASTFETLVNGQGLVAKFKSAGEDLTVEEYASKMGEIISDINEKIADGTIPKHINVDGSVKETTLPDVVSMSFNDVDISLEDLEQDISGMNKEEIGELIKNQIEEKAKDAPEKDASQAEVGNEIQEKELDAEEKEATNEELQQEVAEVEEPTILPEEVEQEAETEVVEQEKEVELEQEVVEEVIQDEGPTQEELKAILAQQQRASNEANVEQQVKEVVDKNDDLGLATNTSTQVVEEKKEEPAALAKDTFFNKVKRGFFNNKVVKKFTELFGKKEENNMEDSVFASSSNNSKPVTKEEDHWGVIEDKNAAARKALEEHEANKQKEAEKVKVGVVESKEEDFEIGDE